MKHRPLLKLLSAATVGLAALACFQAQANPITFNFQENDVPANTSTILGTSSTFTESGYSIKATGYTILDSSEVPLYAKYTATDPNETGLGLYNGTTAPYNDVGQNNEIDKYHFVQIDTWSLKNSVPPAVVTSMGLGSVQTNENARIYGTNTAGSLAGATIIGTIATNGMIQISPADFASFQYFDVTDVGTKPLANTLITSVVIHVPDGGTTAVLLGLGLLGMGMLARRRRRQEVKA